MLKLYSFFFYEDDADVVTFGMILSAKNECAAHIKANEMARKLNCRYWSINGPTEDDWSQATLD